MIFIQDDHMNKTFSSITAYRTVNVTVGTIKKSLANVLCMWFFKKVCHVWDGGLGGRHFLMMFETVRSETLSMPSFKSSPWIRGAPHNGFVLAISSMSFLVSGSNGGLPDPFFRDLNLQNSLNPFLCQRITVSGWTTIKAFLQLFHLLDRIIQNIRSLVRILGRFIVYW